jgi:phage tail-like protein
LLKQTDTMNPPLGFHFRIIFKGLPSGSDGEEGFQSINGLEAFMSEDFPYSSEGKKTTGYKTSYSPLILKRAVVSIKESKLNQWIFSCLNKKRPVPLKEAIIELLDENHEPSMRWALKNLLPISWKLGELNAEKTEVLTETIELRYEKLLFL